MFERFNDSHIKHIIIRYHIEGVKPAIVFAELTDEDALDKYGFEPPEGLTISYLYRRLSLIPSTTIEIVRTEWLNNLLAEPLANKRMRVKELTFLYTQEKKTSEKRHLLKAIQDEVGEESWQDALEKSGGTATVNFIEKLLAKFDKEKYEK